MLNDDLKITGNAGNREEANEVENSSEAAQVKSFRKTCQILGIRIFTILSARRALLYLVFFLLLFLHFSTISTFKGQVRGTCQYVPLDPSRPLLDPSRPLQTPPDPSRPLQTPPDPS